MIFNTLDFSHINFLAVAVSTVAYFLLGAIWYSPVMFVKPWMDSLGLKQETMDKSGVGKLLILSFITTFFICLSLAVLIELISISNLGAAVKLGLLTGFGFVFTTLTINSLFERKSFKLLMINSFYHIVGFVISCLIIVLWK